MELQKIYGDEKLGYSILAREMKPSQARKYLEENLKCQNNLQNTRKQGF